MNLITFQREAIQFAVDLHIIYKYIFAPLTTYFTLATQGRYVVFFYKRRIYAFYSTIFRR